MRGARLRLLAAVVLAAVAAWVGGIYAHPPLYSPGMAARHDGRASMLAYAIDLVNGGRRPLTLTAVMINGEEVPYPRSIVVWTCANVLRVSSLAIRRAVHGPRLDTGPVRGWKLLPHESQGCSYALLVDWEGLPSPRGEIVVSYRYLGLPMRYSVP